ncbi:hypothetical protein [Sphingomicrobium clamense]|uniref:DUF3618 domain-containing protein n=1 Tax=Sphingomicrobium clamense TaxID=2851013 RepID=A0ABS6V6C1_9SPHN|nr:hypothetical protein [Sphingomicrobium sp. B8]MBW0145096.1 hypothetical protein [Sphingomicrobium sp. B8]
MTVDPKVLDAQNRVEIQRAKLMRSVEYGIGQAKRRLAPDLIAAQAWDATKAKVTDTAHEAVVAAKKNPWLVGGIGAAIGLFLARGPLGDALRGVKSKIVDSDAETPKASDPENSPETPVAVAKQAKQRKAGAASKRSRKSANKNSKTEDVK